MEANKYTKQWVMDGTKACIPPNCPVPFTIISAHKISKYVALATVELFDGLPGTLEVSQQRPFLNWCLQWRELAGGAINWNGRNWERVNKLSKPIQLELDFVEAIA